MKSGLDGRNNWRVLSRMSDTIGRLNEVRPRWPEQYPLKLPTWSNTEDMSQ